MELHFPHRMQRNFYYKKKKKEKKITIDQVSCDHYPLFDFFSSIYVAHN